MSNTLVYMSKTATTEDLANRLLTVSRQRGFDLRRLSRDSGIAYSTLRSQLIYKPGRLTAENMFAIIAAIGVDVSEVVGE